MNVWRWIFRLLLGRRLPTTRGQLSLLGLHGRVRLHRDRFGIPLIEADDPRDGPFALGFCHGQDRAFQLEVLLRVVRGTLSELIGADGLPIDRLSRRIGFARAAREQLPLLANDVREALQAYARGVQAGIGLGCRRPQHEFALLGSAATPWQPTDTLAVTKLLSFTLMSNWDAELARLKVLTTDGAEALAALDPTYPEWHAVICPVGQAAGKLVDRLAEDVATFLQWTRPGGGSNNWAIAASRTTTGRPILANDPHLDATLPAHWYLASLRSPTEAVAGATFVGGPLFLVGHNGTAAWGLTAGLVDNTDLFLEEIGPDGTSVRQDNAFLPCPVVEEVIVVKGGEPVTERVLLTPRGPIISPALRDTPEALSLRATWLDPAPINGFFHLPQVRSFAEFRAAFASWPISGQNLVYADVHGTIGWQLIGDVPRRKKGHGTLPLPGADPEVGWHTEKVPFHDIPHLQNPSCGFVVTANNRHLADGVGPFLGVDFIDGYRYEAIHRALAHRRDWDIVSTMQLQLDHYSVAWEEMREFVLATPSLDPDSELALQTLRGWDGRVSAHSFEAAVYELFVAEMVVRVAKARAPQSWRWVVGASLCPLTQYNFGCFRRTSHLIRLLREKPSGWFTPSWDEELADALGEAYRRVRRQSAKTSGRLGWGELRPLLLQHPLSKKPGLIGHALGKIFNLGPYPCGGDADVINQAAALPLEPFRPTNNIASLRAVFDVGAWSNSRFILPSGQSGNPLSPHYADQLPLWQRGEGVPIAFTSDEMRQAAVETLELRPAG